MVPEKALSYQSKEARIRLDDSERSAEFPIYPRHCASTGVGTIPSSQGHFREGTFALMPKVFIPYYLILYSRSTGDVRVLGCACLLPSCFVLLHTCSKFLNPFPSWLGNALVGKEMFQDPRPAREASQSPNSQKRIDLKGRGANVDTNFFELECRFDTQGGCCRAKVLVGAFAGS